MPFETPYNVELLRGSHDECVPRFSCGSTMAFSEADKVAVEQAMVTLAVSGVARVSIDGQSVEATEMSQLERLLVLINSQLASGKNHLGVRFTKLIAPGAWQ